MQHILKIIKLETFERQNKEWPLLGNHILAQYDDTSVVVYQAFNFTIADEIIKNQNYHSDACIKAGVNMNRMTWIKTNFLWMMYRSGWASKSNQECILAVTITRNGFEEIFAKAVDHHHKIGACKEDTVRLQWDPDHMPNGDKVATGRRAIQLGLRGEMFEKFSKEFILNIVDITDFVLDQSKNIGSLSDLSIPLEKVYIPNDKTIQENIKLADATS